MLLELGFRVGGLGVWKGASSIRREAQALSVESKRRVIEPSWPNAVAADVEAVDAFPFVPWSPRLSNAQQGVQFMCVLQLCFLVGLLLG